ncbi:ABC transporter, iron(III) dicitrate-binding periplasmic protein [Calothrix sp. NIES-4101]|nr:ABC transporter, iron(III) dicitrate-binding periplasmic protein [Calothrix sp. NIES-4101]
MKPIKIFLIALVFIIITGCNSYFIQKNKTLNSNSVISDCRVIKHDLGETCIPLNPQRIIALDDIIMETLLALDLKPIAATEANLAGSKIPKLGEKAKGIESLGKVGQANLEKIVRLNPDLILGFSFSTEEYQLFSQIAPTVTLNYVQAAWKEALLSVAELTGKVEKAQKIIGQYQQRVQVIRTVINDSPLLKTVSISRFYAGGITAEFRNQFSFPITILTEIGLSIPEIQHRIMATPDYPYVLVSLETLDLLDADVLFAALDPESEETFQRYQNNPLWQNLNVVKNNQVYKVNSNYWIFGNILSANAILDDIEKYILVTNR